MNTCTECGAVLSGKQRTCSSLCRRRKSRRLLAERAELLPKRAGTLIVLDDVGRAKLSALLTKDMSFAPEGISAARWRGIASGQIQVLPATEVRQICAWYPGVTRALCLPTAEAGETPDPRRASVGLPAFAETNCDTSPWDD
jgi:predicted nucleic acid-binding Zn ribbon protein